MATMTTLQTIEIAAPAAEVVLLPDGRLLKDAIAWLGNRSIPGHYAYESVGSGYQITFSDPRVAAVFRREFVD